MNGNNNGSTSYDPTYLDSFGVKHIPEGIKKIIGNINIITNINRIQSYDQFDNVWTLLYWIVLMPAQECKKCTFLDNLWAITPRRKYEN